VVAEDIAARQAAAYHLFHERAPYEEGAVALGQHQGAALVDLEVAVVTHEPIHFDGAKQHPGKAAVGILQAPEMGMIRSPVERLRTTEPIRTPGSVWLRW
jgi:hypothetical protein